MKKINYLKAGFTVLMAVYGILCAKDLPDSSMLDRVNLIPHEAGHLLFSWFGEFLMVIGGTLCQLAVPIALAVYFFLRREFFSSSVALFWTGQNFFGISVYIKDAQAMELPMLSIGGNEDAIYDWNYILTKLGLIRWDHLVGNIALGSGMLIIALAVLWAFTSSFEPPVENGA